MASRTIQPASAIGRCAAHVCNKGPTLQVPPSQLGVFDGQVQSALESHAPLSAHSLCMGRKGWEGLGILSRRAQMAH